MVTQGQKCTANLKGKHEFNVGNAMGFVGQYLIDLPYSNNKKKIMLDAFIWYSPMLRVSYWLTPLAPVISIHGLVINI